ncbi:MAG: DEAD/DEAH box helicase [Brevundimonas sp.]|nr:MAG: DEAD/DEAH box helicase [Brevundimonas sp.]
MAARLWREGAAQAGRDLLFLAASERRADEIARALGAMTGPDGPAVMVFPPWDCLPYDRAPPSRESMGRRMAVLAELAEPTTLGRLVITSPEAVMQRTPPPAVVRARFDIAAGAPLDREALAGFARRTGYIHDERIDEPGEIAFLGEVIDLYPAAGPSPFRIVTGEDGVVAEIKAFDPISQRSQDSVPALCVRAASECVLAEDDAEAGLCAGGEHHLAEQYDSPLSNLFEALAGVPVLQEPAVTERLERVAAQIEEAYEARRSFGEADGLHTPAPERLYLSLAEAVAATAGAETVAVDGMAPTPAFAMERAPGAALKRYVQTRQAEGRRIILAGLPHEHRILNRLLKRNGIAAPQGPESWQVASEAEAGALVAVIADLDGGYDDPATDQVVLTPTDITGGRLARATGASESPFGETELRVGDVVIHEDHGLGVLQALEQIEADGVRRDVLRLEYHGGTTLLAPVEEFGRIWRYGSEPSAVSLDRLNTGGWFKRRAEVSAQIDATAARMVEMAKVRETATTPAVTPPKAAYARFTSRFPFPESVDQLAAIDAVLADLASGRPMNRLVCGDVGFGKTEVAMRAAAAVALTGRQVMLVAPTTVLARQHYETFRRRFDGAGVQVAPLSRLIDASEAKAVRAGLADGSIQVVVGTQALADAALEFADLALVIIDEEHRFGAKMKAELADRAPHLLAMSATPIPRTLQGAMVGIQDVSVIASPPARRRPIRTFLTDFDGGSVRTVLMREKGRGGQSFVVAPRIEDLAPLAERLAVLVPELELVSAHGKLRGEELDAVMTGFAEGRGDILLATNIIENGLDVPRANTMLVWRPDRFGLAQLHQLRGRVGRGRRQGFTYLLSDPEAPIAVTTRTRLQTLEALDRLGAGFAISARDLDLRGGGDLVGDEQAGHIRLIGAGLYQRLLGRALRAARGEGDADPLPPKLTVPSGGSFPEDYVPDPTVRINLYARLAQLVSADEIDALHEEIEDRFGPLPEAALTLLAASRLTALGLAAGVTEVVSGPKATAFTFGPRRARHLSSRLSLADAHRWSEGRLIVPADEATPHDHAFLERMLEDIAAA